MKAHSTIIKLFDRVRQDGVGRCYPTVERRLLTVVVPSVTSVRQCCTPASVQQNQHIGLVCGAQLSVELPSPMLAENIRCRSSSTTSGILVGRRLTGTGVSNSVIDLYRLPLQNRRQINQYGHPHSGICGTEAASGVSINPLMVSADYPGVLYASFCVVRQLPVGVQRLNGRFDSWRLVVLSCSADEGAKLALTVFKCHRATIPLQLSYAHIATTKFIMQGLVSVAVQLSVVHNHDVGGKRSLPLASSTTSEILNGQTTRSFVSNTAITLAVRGFVAMTSETCIIQPTTFRLHHLKRLLASS
ncbi:MAG: hypothetical protein R2788_01935 [Saprospiraceae bacterium]